jgi:hypothetical protein
VDEWYDGKLTFESATPVRVVAPNGTPMSILRWIFPAASTVL